MASQFLTVTLIAGESSLALATTLDAWTKLRVALDPSEVCSTQWPPEVHASIDAFVENLAANAFAPAVAYYSRHFDSWSMGDIFTRLMQPKTADPLFHLLSKRYEIWARNVEVCAQLADHATQLSRQFNDTPEYQWVANRIVEASLSFRPRFQHAMLLLIREVTGGLVLDNERELNVVPAWIPSYGG